MSANGALLPLAPIARLFQAAPRLADIEALAGGGRRNFRDDMLHGLASYCRILDDNRPLR